MSQRSDLTSSFVKTLSELGQGVMKSLQEARIGETIESGVNSVREKLNDPNFQKDVKEKAQAGWSWLSSAAGSIWSAAKEAATQIASELNEGGTPRPTSRTPREGGTPRPENRTPREGTNTPKRDVRPANLSSAEDIAIDV